MKTSTERQRELIRTVVLLRILSGRLGAVNHYQFAGRYDDLSDEPSTQASGKWRAYFNGERHISARTLKSLCKFFPDAGKLYQDGPSDLWLAMWGDVQELWPLCRTRYCTLGPSLDDRTWQSIEGEFQDEKTFGATLREFESELLLADAYGEALTLRHLTEAIALYRLHQFINSAAPSDVSGSGLYRCVRVCLDDEAVHRLLNSLVVYEFFASELAKVEVGRLEFEDSYRAASVAVEDIEAYTTNPRKFVSNNQRWNDLRFDWVG